LELTSPIAQAVAAGRRFITSELTPPIGSDLTPTLEQGRQVKGLVTAIHVNDNLLAIARCSPLALCARLAQEGIEPVFQMSLRHRNRIQVQSDVLAASALGIRTMLIMTGYPIHIGSDPEAVDASDLDTDETLRRLRTLVDDGRLFGGGPVVGDPPDLFIGAVDNLLADAPQSSVAKIEAKIDAGARMIQIQGVFYIEPLKLLMAAVRQRGLHERVPFIAGVLPFRSLAHLRERASNTGQIIPTKLVEFLEGHPDEEAGLQIIEELAIGALNVEGICGLHIRSQGYEECVGPIVGALQKEALIEAHKEETATV
jgi:methylenetetrahydrofolate reductase (NADH)